MHLLISSVLTVCSSKSPVTRFERRRKRNKEKANLVELNLSCTAESPRTGISMTGRTQRLFFRQQLSPNAGRNDEEQASLVIPCDGGAHHHLATKRGQDSHESFTLRFQTKRIQCTSTRNIHMNMHKKYSSVARIEKGQYPSSKACSIKLYILDLSIHYGKVQPIPPRLRRTFQVQGRPAYNFCR